MWQISCVVITAVSIYIHLVAGLAVWMNNMDFNIIGDIVFFFFDFSCFYTLCYSSGGHFSFGIYIS